MLSPLLAGLGLGFSLIIAIGAQNLFVLRQGLRREHVVLVAAICAISDAALIALGVSGIGLVLNAVPWLIDVVRWAGAVFLVVYGLLAARRAWRPSGHTLEAEGSAAADPAAASAPATTAVRAGTRALPVALTCLALTWLNPHVYLDTVVLLGSVAVEWEGRRFAFGLGAVVASFVFFFGLGYGARLPRPLFARPGAWRVLDVLVACVMWSIAAGLAFG
jgi:L-lysine exporter family protein LysE/ArgO